MVTAVHKLIIFFSSSVCSGDVNNNLELDASLQSEPEIPDVPSEPEIPDDNGESIHKRPVR